MIKVETEKVLGKFNNWSIIYISYPDTERSQVSNNILVKLNLGAGDS